MKTILPIVFVCIGIVNAEARPTLPEYDELFDDTRVHRVEIFIDTADLNKMTREFWENDQYPATFIIHYESHSDTVNQVGIRVKGKTSRQHPKKSYKISFNTYTKGNKYKGLEKLKLNANYNDPTQLRAHLSTRMYEYAGVAVARSSFADLYVNGIYFGLYNLKEHIDEEFAGSRFGSKKGNLYKCLFGANLIYKGKQKKDYLNFDGEKIYTLKTNKKENDYSGLMDFMRMLNHTPDEEFKTKLEQNFNVDDYLKIMAVDILIANWDNYIFMSNNFYLYDNPETGKFDYIPYDFDNTFGIDWVGYDWGKSEIYNWAMHRNTYLQPDSIKDVPKKFAEQLKEFYDVFRADTVKPLYSRILEIDEYKNQFNAYLKWYMEEQCNIDSMSVEIDRLFTMISPSLEKDTCDNFTWEQVKASITGPLEKTMQFGSYAHGYLPYGLKEFIVVSRENILPQIEPLEPDSSPNRLTENQYGKPAE